MKSIFYPKVTIITATYNSAQYLKQCIQSVVSQTYDHVEFIIIDAQSTDRTLDILQQYDENITEWISEPDKGTYDAFNKGIRMSTGDILYFLGSDDYLYNKHVIADVVEEFSRYPAIEYLYGNIALRNEDTQYRYIEGKALELTDVQTGRFPHHQAVFVKKEFFEKYGLFDLNYLYSGDIDLFVKSFAHNPATMHYYDQIIAEFRFGGISNNQENWQITCDEQRQIIKKYLGIERQIEIPKDKVQYFKRWLKKKLHSNQSIFFKGTFNDKAVIAIFGAGELAELLLHEARAANINVKCFLDNDSRKQGNTLFGVPIYSPTYLCKNSFDAIILSIEDEKSENVVRRQLSNFLKDYMCPVYSWRELISKTSEA